MAIIECKECGREISEQAKTCPHCGYQNRDSLMDQAKNQAKQIGNKVKIKETFKKISSTIRPGFNRFKSKLKSKTVDGFLSMNSDFQTGGSKKLIRNKFFIGVCLVSLILVFLSVGIENSNTQTRNEETVQNSEYVESGNFIMLDSINFLEKKKASTDIQYNEFVKSLKNKKIKGTGSVLETRESYFGYEAYVQAVDKGGLVTVQFKVSKDIALSLGRGQEVTFTGKFNGVDIEQSEEIIGFNTTGGVNRSISTDIVISLKDTKIEG